MKKILIVICFVVLVLIVGIGFFNNDTINQKSNTEYLRLHIRANSNSEADQTVKYKVKQAVVEFLTPMLSNCTSKNLAVNEIQNNKQQIEEIATTILKQNDFNYSCNLKINNEYFPTRTYNDFTLQSGFYDAVILELGEAQGDNWWCVMYPPLCFTDFEYGKNIIYKSKLLEIINNFFN